MATLYQRVFDIDPLECSSCRGRMRFVEVIEEWLGRAASCAVGTSWLNRRLVEGALSGLGQLKVRTAVWVLTHLPSERRARTGVLWIRPAWLQEATELRGMGAM